MPGRSVRGNPRWHSSLVRQTAPQFTTNAVIDGKITKFASKDLGGKYWVLLFYPMDFTFVCPTEIVAFDDALEDFGRLGCKVMAVSVDSEHSHLAWTRIPRSRGGLATLGKNNNDIVPPKIPLLADLTKSISRNYGVLLEDQGFALRLSSTLGS